MSKPLFSIVTWIKRGPGRDLPDGHRLLAALLADYINKPNEVAFPSLAELVNVTGWQKRRVCRVLARLTAEGGPFVKVPGGGRGRTNTYAVNWDALETGVPADTVSAVQQRDETVSPGARKGVSSDLETVSAATNAYKEGTAQEPPKEPPSSAPTGARSRLTTTTSVNGNGHGALTGTSTAPAWVEAAWKKREAAPVSLSDLRRNGSRLRAAYVAQARLSGVELSEQGWIEYLASRSIDEQDAKDAGLVPNVVSASA